MQAVLKDKVASDGWKSPPVVSHKSYVVFTSGFLNVREVAAINILSFFHSYSSFRTAEGGCATRAFLYSNIH